MTTKSPLTIAVYESEDSLNVHEYIEVSKLSMAAQQLITNGLVFQIYRDPVGAYIIVDIDTNKYPALD